MDKEVYKIKSAREFRNSVRVGIEEGPIFEEWQGACVVFMKKLVDRVHRAYPQASVKEVYAAIKDVSVEWIINGPDGEHYPGFALIVLDEEQGKVIREALKESATSIPRHSGLPAKDD